MATTSARDIPNAAGRDNLTAVAAKSVPVTKGHPLPTPPNSISPSLPPHGLKAYATRASTAAIKLDLVDSDLDLQDGHPGLYQDSFERGNRRGSPTLDAAGAITSDLLATHHLPEILLNHGPMPLGHIIGWLTCSVPGFSGIPPAKAKYLVYQALNNNQKHAGAGGRGNVRFEQVGDGQWNARLRNQATFPRSPTDQSPPPSMPSSFGAGLPIARGNQRPLDKARLRALESSWAGDSAVFSHDEMDVTMLEADKMSLDPYSSTTTTSSSSGPAEDELMEDDPADLTDDEDWAAVGAAALRAASYSASGPGRNLFAQRTYYETTRPGGGLPSTAKATLPASFHYSSFSMTSNSKEREAVEALLRLGSV